MITVGTMRLPQPEPLDDLEAFLRGLEPDGGYWATMRRLADHDHSGGLMGAPVAGGGGGAAEVTITGTEGLTVVESPANVFALGLTASPDASNTIEIRSNGIYSAAGAIPPEYVTDAELAAALGPYALDTDLANHAAAADPHPTYLTQTEGDARYTQGGLTQSTADTRYVQLTGGSVLTGLLGPSTTNTRDLGTTALRWRKLWAVDAEFTNAPTVGGSALLTQATADALFLTPAEGNAAYATPASVTSAISTHEGATNPHPTYTTDAEVATAIATHAGAADPHPTYSTAAELTSAITAHEALANPHAVYLTQAEGDALYRPLAYVTDVTITPDASLTATESPANTFALAARLSPDGGNALALRANGLYATVPGGSGLPTTGGTMTGSIAVGTTNLYDLGATALRWRKLWATDVETTNTPTVGGTALPTFTTADARYLQSATATTTYVPLAGGSVLTGLLGPTTTNTRDLGTTTLRWRKLWAVDGEFTNVPTVGGVSMDSRYALASALTALTTRVTALETSVTALKTHVHELGTFGAGTLAPTGGIP